MNQYETVFILTPVLSDFSGNSAAVILRNSLSTSMIPDK